MKRPAKSANKAAWIAWAEHLEKTAAPAADNDGTVAKLTTRIASLEECNRQHVQTIHRYRSR